MHPTTSLFANLNLFHVTECKQRTRLCITSSMVYKTTRVYVA